MYAIRDQKDFKRPAAADTAITISVVPDPNEIGGVKSPPLRGLSVRTIINNSFIRRDFIILFYNIPPSPLGLLDTAHTKQKRFSGSSAVHYYRNVL